MASKRDTCLSRRIRASLELSTFTCVHDEGNLPRPSLELGKEDGCILIISGTDFDAWRAALAYKMEGNHGESKTIPPIQEHLINFF